jgi:two-component system, LytTR family, sensor histidine kinase AlgZ
MHPILGRVERLAAYLGAWLIVGLLLGGVFTRLGLSWSEALALLLPLLFVYSFVCLSAWYVSRATPLSTSGLFRVLSTSGLAAAVAGAVWLALARLWIGVLGDVPAFAASTARYDQQMPFLFAVGVLLFLLALAVHYALLALEAVREAERHRLELEVLTRDAELRALRAQVDPHFLYNSLNSISALTGSDPAGARRMCLLLGDFLRSTLNHSARQRIPLADELTLADRFLSIEQVRFGSRLQVERHIDETASSCRVPPLLLQPLFENAVTHGIAGLLEGGVICLDVSRNNGRCAIVLENPCDTEAPASRSGGMGLDNVRRRLAATFGREASLQTRMETGRFRVEIHLPCSTDD